MKKNDFFYIFLWKVLNKLSPTLIKNTSADYHTEVSEKGGGANLFPQSWFYFRFRLFQPRAIFALAILAIPLAIK